MNVINDNTTNVVTRKINNDIFIVTATDAGLTLLNETTNVAVNSTDTSYFSKVEVMDDFIYALKDSDNAVYKSLLKIQNIASIIELETVLLPDTVSGNSALEFDGVDDYLSAADNVNLNFGTGDFSVEVLFDAIATPTNYAIFSKSRGLTSQIDLYLNSGGINLRIFGSTVVECTYADFADGTNHIIYTRIGDNIHMYINGVQVQSWSGVASFDWNNTELFVIANSNTHAYPLKGTIHKVKLFNYALPLEKIRDYSNGVELYDEDKWGKNLTSDPLVIDTVYKIVSFVAGDDFTNVGGTNVSGDTFIATGTTPTTWNSSLLVKEGCVSEWKADNYNVTTLADGTTITGQSSVNASSMSAGNTYTILTLGTTNFTLYGASNNLVGTTFIANGAGSGTGTVSNVAYLYDSEFIEGTAADISSSSLIATQSVSSNQPIIKQLPTKHTLTDISKLRYGLKYDGSTQYSSAADDPNLNFGTGDFSIEVYFDAIATSSNYTIFSKSLSQTNDIDLILNTTSINLRVFASTVVECTYADFADGTNHIIYTRIGDNIHMYLNSVLVQSWTGVALFDWNNSNNLLLCKLGSWYLNGTIYKAKLYNYALSQSDVDARWNNGDPLSFIEPYETRGASNTPINSTDFNGSTDGWAAQSGWSFDTITNFRANSAATSNQSILKNVGFQANKKYRVKWDVQTFTSGSVSLYTTSNGILETITSQANGIITEFIYAPGGDSYLYFRGDITNGFIGSVTNVIVTEIGNVADWDFTKFPSSVSTEDGSGNGNTLTHVNSPTVISTEPLPKSIAANSDKVIVGFKSDMEVDNYKQGGIVILESD